MSNSPTPHDKAVEIIQYFKDIVKDDKKARKCASASLRFTLEALEATQCKTQIQYWALVKIEIDTMPIDKI